MNVEELLKDLFSYFLDTNSDKSELHPRIKTALKNLKQAEENAVASEKRRYQNDYDEVTEREKKIREKYCDNERFCPNDCGNCYILDWLDDMSYDYPTSPDFIPHPNLIFTFDQYKSPRQIDQEEEYMENDHDDSCYLDDYGTTDF